MNSQYNNNNNNQYVRSHTWWNIFLIGKTHIKGACACACACAYIPNVYIYTMFVGKTHGITHEFESDACAVILQVIC